MNASSIEAPPDFNKFEYAGLTLAPSVSVKPPRVKESPIHFECRVRETIEINNEPRGGSIVIGMILHIHTEDRVMLGQAKIDLSALKPVGRLMGGGFCRVTDLIQMERPKSIIGGNS